MLLLRKDLHAVIGVVTVLVLGGTTFADTFETTFDRFDPAEWEAVNCTPEILPDGGGLRIRVEPGQTWVGITGKRWWDDTFDARVEYELVGAPDDTNVCLRLLNDEKKRRVDIVHNLRLYKDGKTGEMKPSSYSNLSSYHDSKLMGRRGSHTYGLTGGLRFVKEGTQIFGFQGGVGGGWRGPLSYRFVPMHYDCERYRLGVYVLAPKKGKPFDLVIKRVWVWHSLYRAADRKEEEGGYSRAWDEPEKDTKIWRFDFGPVGQQLEHQHIPISQWTMYNERRGWGWKTSLEPIWSSGKIPSLSNKDAIRMGLEPTPNLHYWRGGADMKMNYCIAHKKRYILSVSHGGDYIQFFKRWMDLKIPCERDMVCASRPYGFPYNHRIEADQWERRAATYVDDDLCTDFVVDLPNDRYTLLVGVGYSGTGAGGGSPFMLEAEGRPVKKSLSGWWRRCTMQQADDVEVTDGQLNVTLRANRRLAMNRVDAWELGVSWQINYLVIVPSERRDQIKAEQWRLIQDRGRKVRQVTFVEGDPINARVVNNHLVVDEKPAFPILWQAFHSNTQMHYPYYLWGNTMATIGVGWHFKGSMHFMQNDWQRLSAADDYPWREINTLNLAYVWGSNTLLRVSGLLSFLPKAIAGEGGSLQDARGRASRWNVQPPLNSRLHREVQREAYTMTSQQLKLHPDIMGHYMYEEYWHPSNRGYDHNSVNQFHKWLMEKYETLETLNAEWGTKYVSFNDIKPPPKPEESACWANFRRFRMHSQDESIRYPRELLNELEPDRITFGAKGDYATASWYYADDIELFGWYSTNTSRGAAYYFGQTPMCGGHMFGCPWGWDDGRKQLDHKPAYPKKYRNPTPGDGYTRFMRNILRGARGFYNEEYNGGIQHMFHRTRMIEKGHKAGTIRLWYGALAQWDPPAFEGPDVFISPDALRYTRFMAWAYRCGPVWLPTKVPTPPVAIVSTDESYYEIPGTGQLFSTRDIQSILDQIEVPVDILRSGRFDDYTKYKVLVLGTFSNALRPEQADAIRDFHKKGGKLLWFTNGGFRSGINLKFGKERPRFALTDLTGCEFKDAKEMGVKGGLPVLLVPNAITPNLTEDVHVANTNSRGQVIVPRNGCTVLAKAGDTVYGAASPDGSVVTINFPLGIAHWKKSKEHQEQRRALQRKLRSFFRDLIVSTWEVDPGYEIEGADDLTAFDMSVLNGDGYSLFGIVNTGKKEQEITAKPGLPAGRYELIDITGRRPIIVDDKEKRFVLDPDLAGLNVNVLVKDVSHGDLRQKGIRLKVGANAARVVLARPVGTEVAVDIPDYTLKNRCSRPVTIVVGDGAPQTESDAAEKVRKFLASKEVPVKVVKASEVKIKETRHEVRVDPRDGKKRERGKRGDQSQWFLVEVFENRPIDTENHLICIGSETTNALVKHLADVKTFVYDKVFENVTPEYPGPGRGVVQLVDSVNFPFYQANRATRDAILVGGSDAAGTVKAADRFLAMIADLPKYVPPKIEETMEIDDTPDEKELRKK